MLSKIITILSEVKKDDKLIHSLTAQSDLINEVGLSSLEVVSFIFKVEEEFNLDLDFEKFNYSHLSSIESFMNYLTSCRSNSFTA